MFIDTYSRFSTFNCFKFTTHNACNLEKNGTSAQSVGMLVKYVCRNKLVTIGYTVNMGAEFVLDTLLDRWGHLFWETWLSFVGLKYFHDNENDGDFLAQVAETARRRKSSATMCLLAAYQSHGTVISTMIVETCRMNLAPVVSDLCSGT